MDAQDPLRFDTLRECQDYFLAVLAAARTGLELFDPDFSAFPLGSVEADRLLRALLARGATLRLAMHDPKHIERHHPRFLRLLRDFGHLTECRVTPSSLRQLTDSFCIADGVHIVRRFHSGHMRGEAAFGAPQATELPRERFAAIWEESRPALHPTVTGL